MADQKEAEPKVMNNRFTPEQITSIRADRAELTEDGKPVNTHKALGEKYGTSAGVISQIVRNRTYADPDYKPVNDRFDSNS
jgi:uncharacterized protein YerC